VVVVVGARVVVVVGARVVVVVGARVVVVVGATVVVEAPLPSPVVHAVVRRPTASTPARMRRRRRSSIEFPPR
jgi:hypothetical protein